MVLPGNSVLRKIVSWICSSSTNRADLEHGFLQIVPVGIIVRTVDPLLTLVVTCSNLFSFLNNSNSLNVVWWEPHWCFLYWGDSWCSLQRFEIDRISNNGKNWIFAYLTADDLYFRILDISYWCEVADNGITALCICVSVLMNWGQQWSTKASKKCQLYRKNTQIMSNFS